MKKYAEAPWYWYAMLLALSFFAGAVWFPYLRLTLNSFVRYRVDRGAQRSNNAPWWSYIVALILGTFITVREYQMQPPSQR